MLVVAFPAVPADTGKQAADHCAFVKPPCIGDVQRQDRGWESYREDIHRRKKVAFAASPLVLDARFGHHGSAVKTKLWVKLTAPGGEPVHINVEQVTSVRPDTEMSGANAQLDLASGKFQRVQEHVDRVMQLILATLPGAPGICSSSRAAEAALKNFVHSLAPAELRMAPGPANLADGLLGWWPR